MLNDASCWNQTANVPVISEVDPPRRVGHFLRANGTLAPGSSGNDFGLFWGVFLNLGYPRMDGFYRGKSHFRKAPYIDFNGTREGPQLLSW